MFLTVLQKNADVRVNRGGVDADIIIPFGAISANSDSIIQNFGVYPTDVRPIILEVVPGTPAEKSGILAKDSILTADSVKMNSDVQLMAEIHRHAGKPMTLEVKRADGIHQIQVVPGSDGHIGVQLTSIYTGPRDIVHYSITQAASAGATAVKLNFSALGNLVVNLVSGKASIRQNLAGPVAIAKMAGKTAEEGIDYLFALMAGLSISLAALNILPVPALDGGHLVFILIEGAIRREVPQKIKIGFQQVGFVLLLALMAFIVYNDLTR